MGLSNMYHEEIHHYQSFMQKFIFYIIFCSSLILFVTSCNTGKDSGEPHNLIINGSAEIPRYDSTPSGWLNVQGHGVSSEGDSISHDCAYAQNGKYLFFAGNDTLGILQQDVSVADYARDIDKHSQQFIFSGYVQSLDQGPNSDQSQIILTGLDGSKKKITQIFNTDSTRSLNKWRLVTDTFFAQQSTRFIRIQLIAIRHVGGDNDGYFDNMVLNAIPEKTSINKMIIISVAIICGLVAGFIITRKKKKNWQLKSA